MPVAWRLQVLETRLSERFGCGFRIESTDMYALPSDEQSVCVDAIVETQGDFPVVLVNGSWACVGDIDVPAIADAVAGCAEESPEVGPAEKPTGVTREGLR
jgi:hypothetical protein